MEERNKYNAKKELEYHFQWNRKYYYTDLLKMFTARDIDNYVDYKLDLYLNLHCMEIDKDFEHILTKEYIYNDLLKCSNDSMIEEDINIAFDWFNRRMDYFYRKTAISDFNKNIRKKDVDLQKFKNFIIEYSSWLSTELEGNKKLSFYKISNKVDELLSVKEQEKYDEKRMAESFQDEMASLISGNFDDEIISVDRDRMYNLSYDTDIDSACFGLREDFVLLFHKVYKEFSLGGQVDEEMKEMQFIFNYIKKLGNTNKRFKMFDSRITEMFFLHHDSQENILNSVVNYHAKNNEVQYICQREIDLYDKFQSHLLSTESVAKAFEMIFEEI